ncbi:MAG: tripartite tricarboxylate transporter substrate binding protein [Burkholderiales bacterium]|jgi:tripartite-type tricarboxylate transporter receptor subunit TctC|nr:tripartite tricarboxylate transporter substrate binding protein [Burkholderiales bacterium]
MLNRSPLKPAVAVLAGAGLVLGAAPLAAQTQAYPAKPVRVVVPLAPGGGSDIVARIAAQALSDAWGQSLVIDNRPGAGGTIGTAIVAKAPADGYTALVSSSTMAIGPALFRNIGFDVLKDFAPVTLIADQPSIIAVNPKVPAKTLPELIALFKKEPGKYAFGSAGNGTASHLANELFKLSAKVDTIHVPYKSAGLATTGLLSGEIQYMVTNMATALPQVRSGRLTGVAVTSEKRVDAAPEIPTASEAGLPGFAYTTWYGMLVPAGSPAAVVQRFHGDLAKQSRDPQVAQRFSSQGLTVRVSAPQEFSKYLSGEVARWQQVVNAAGIQKQ